MLFSTQSFLLLFLPLALFCFYLPWAREGQRKLILLLASLAFYACWDIRFVPFLLFMVAATWSCVLIALTFERRWVLLLGVCLNLLVLVCFNYTNFLLENFLGFFGIHFEAFSIILPLGISFFTFQQVSYLLDVRRGTAGDYNPLDYFLYVCFFPQLIAGPIVRHNELIPQFSVVFGKGVNFEYLTRGLVLFILGLSKKVFIADELAALVDPVFESASTSPVNFSLAWQATLGFALQLYFDFSSYSDMALGLGCLFGLKLPINFDRPYVSLTVREFWRRWHITLSRFFTDYVYIPLGGNRHKYGIYLVIFLKG